MSNKKISLDPGTVQLAKRLLAMPPKHHDDLKVGRPASKKKRGPKGDSDFNSDH
jgi:hypothetical protein